MEEEADLLYIEDVERRLGASRDAVRSMMRRGHLPRPGRLGRRLVWRRDEFDRWLEERAEDRR